jgi:hypothetical protein
LLFFLSIFFIIQTVPVMKSKSELYLKNFELLNVEPVVSLSLHMDNDLNESSFRSILSLCKQWYIKNITIQSDGIINSQFLQYLEQSINDQFLFERNDFKFSFEITAVPYELMRALLKEQTAMVLPVLINTNEYEIANVLWGKEFIRFTGSKPEVYQLQTRQSQITLNLPNAHHIKAVFASPDMKFTSLTGITEKLDSKSGTLLCPWKSSKEVFVFVIRQIDGWIATQSQLYLNYFNPLFWKIYQNFFNQRLGRYAKYFESWTVGGVARKCPVKHILLFEKNLPSDMEVLLTFWHPMEQTPEDIHSIILHEEKKHFNNLCRDGISFKNQQNDTDINWNVSSLFMHESYLEQSISLTKCAANIQINIDPFPMQSSSKKYLFIKLLVSLIHHYKRQDPVIRTGNLLNLNMAFEDQMWYLHWLLSLGLIRFNFQLKYVPGLINNDFFNSIPTGDPSYKAYPEWFAYINQLAHFLKDGIHRCDVLILYPDTSMSSEKSSNIREIVETLNHNAIDFDFIDIDTFLEKKQTVFDSGKIFINQEAFSFLVLPQVEALPIPVLERIHDYFNSGGIVIAIGTLPSMQEINISNKSMEAICSNIWFNDSSMRSTKFKTNKLTGKGYYQSDPKLLPDILLDNPTKLNFRIESQQPNIHSIVRESPDSYNIYLFNHSRANEFKGTIITGHKGIPYLWNFRKAESEKYLRWFTKGYNLHIPVVIPPKQILLFMIKKESIAHQVQIARDNLDKIESIIQSKENLQITGIIHKPGKYHIQIIRDSHIDQNTIDIDDHAPILKISDKNWHLQFIDKKISSDLGDLCWHDPFYSGEIIYKKIILIPEKYLEADKLYLSLGKVKNWVSVEINEKKLGLSIVPPHDFDITTYIKKGKNLLTIKVNNILANKLSQKSGGVEGGFHLKEYGLFGPVRIIPCSFLTYTF